MQFQTNFCKSYLMFLLCMVAVFPLFLYGQSPYQEGWQALDNKDVKKAIRLFEKEVKEEGAKKKEALISLTLLYERVNQIEKSRAAFHDFMDASEDPYPVVAALRENQGVIGDLNNTRDRGFIKLLKRLYKDPKNKGKLEMTVLYSLGATEMYRFDAKKSLKYYDQINNIREWSYVGPFDNVMNSGFDKDFGVVAHPEAGAEFESKYGAMVTWFYPPAIQTNGYLFKNTYFSSYHSIIYAQTFVQCDKAQEVLMKFGYSGSMKIWVNDVLVFSEPSKRTTEIDYFTVKGKLNKGYNRILVQLGEHEVNSPNFTLRFTDLSHNPLTFPTKRKAQPYTKGSDFEFVPYFALTTLKEKVKQHPEDPLYKLLLHKMYLDAFEINNAERVLKPLLEKAPENYLYLLSMNLLYGKAENETLQNKYYDLLTKHYPKDRDILANDISKYQKEKNKTKVKELIDEYLKRYSTPYIELVYQILVDKLDENYEAAIRKINKLYAKYPYDYYAVAAKYEITSAVYNNPQAARVVLRDFLKKNFNYSIASELANNYVENGLPRKAINLYEEIAELLDYSMYPYTNISNIYARQSDYDEAIAVAKKIIANRPYDHETLASLGFFYMQKEDKKKALHYYEKALSYYPFDAETNDKIRELKGLSTSLELVENLKPEDIIAAYEKDFTPSLKKPYDIVLDEKTTILFKSKATAKVQHYILKLNTEQALKDWQRWNIGRTSGMKLTINEAKNIKTNGNTIDAERHGAEVVFTNLEVGDYIYLYYTEQQRSGGKSDLFVSDHFSLNSYYPIYRKRYTVLSEKGLDLVYETINTDMKPEQSEVEGFVKYQWKVLNPELLEDEPNSPSFSDIAQRIHISLGNSWYDIAEWYNDLSGHQARADYTIEQINKELFEGKNYSDEEKAKVIYDFVCKTIQYSSIDFRQSSYIPQKAADVYHSRLGDCKDISTLYAAIARKAGLNADLVLINTRNNGQKDVLLPSLNFNHCMVKVNFGDKAHYLELTDPNLPYGNLYWYHDGAAILEIPSKGIPKDIKLKYLTPNEGFESITTRKSNILVKKDATLEGKVHTTHTGIKAAATCDNYFNKDIKDSREDMRKAVASKFTSKLKLGILEFEHLKPRSNKASYYYTYTVDDEVLKVGSLRSLKVPFSDILFGKNLLEKEEKRHYDFNFLYYENRNRYDETIDITLEAPLAFIEVPQDIRLSFKDFKYELSFKKLSKQHIQVHRVYSAPRRNISPTEFEQLKGFIKEVLAAEKTNVVFK